jgi:hypothetical protein
MESQQDDKSTAVEAPASVPVFGARKKARELAAPLPVFECFGSVFEGQEVPQAAHNSGAYLGPWWMEGAKGSTVCKRRLRGDETVVSASRRRPIFEGGGCRCVSDYRRPRDSAPPGSADPARRHPAAGSGVGSSAAQAGTVWLTGVPTPPAIGSPGYS